MDTSLNLLALLNLLGAGQGLLLALALLSVRRGNRVANRILAALVAAIAINVGGAVVRTSHYDFIYPHLSRLHDPFTFLAVPLLFLYIKYLISGKAAFERREFLHLIPFGLCVFYLTPYYFQSSAAKYESLMSEAYAPTMGAWYYFRSTTLMLLALVYLILIFSMLFAYLRREQKPNSVAERAVRFQVKFIAIGFMVLFVGGVLRFTLDHSARTNLLVPLGASALIYAIGYLEMRKTDAGAEVEAQAAPEVEDPTPAKRYEKSTLTPERSERYLNKLLQCMENEKPYLDGDLTLQKLALKLNVSAPHLSQIINERLNQNFFDFINAYRVEEVKRKLVDPSRKHYTLLAIAEEVGFSSKSAFNAVFKKHVQMTPSEFKKSLNGGNRNH